MIGRTYLERGQPVVVLARWSGKRAEPWCGIPLVWYPRTDGKPHSKRGPLNVLIQRADGTKVVRSFRGLWLPK
jgi:acetyl esterase